MINKMKKHNILRRCLLIILKLLSMFNKVIPKKENKILFYDSLRDSLDDNAEAFYYWLMENGYANKYRFAICVPNEKGYNNTLKYRPIGALFGVYEYLTSKYVFFSFGDFRIEPSSNQVVVNLWHGTPLKRIGKLSDDKNLLTEKLDNFTYVLASSDLYAPVMAEAFGCSISKVKVLGHTRNDYLFSSGDSFKKVGLDVEKFNKCILWMPTFRQSKDNRFSDSDFLDSETLLPILDEYEKLTMFDEKLQALNVLLVIKVHPYAKFKEVQLTNILMMKNEDIISKGVKLYEFVKEFDALITDYSSIYFDFMLMNRPLGFTLDDYQSYSCKRGFVFDNAIDFLPGNHIYCSEDMEKFIISVKCGLDEFRDERNALLPKVCKYIDGNNCKRLAEELGIDLN